MHIPDGFLPVGVCAAGYAISIAAAAYSLKKINTSAVPTRDVPRASLVTAAFFIISLISIPVPPTSVHLLLNGLIGVLLGYFAFPAVLVALFLQAIMFGHGGLVSLGVNAAIMGLPAMVSAFLYRNLKTKIGTNWTAHTLLGFGVGALGIGLSAVLFIITIVGFIPANIDAQAEKAAVYASSLIYIPLMFIEGIITALILNYLKKVKPDVLDHKL